jgi:hypothetical protein
MSEESELSRLPGYEQCRDGMDALRKGEFNSIAAQLILMARTRLGNAGLPLPPHSQPVPAHLTFYALLAERFPDPHFRYNASLQRLDKFCRAVERQR